jgi:hypothetical protein
VMGYWHDGDGCQPCDPKCVTCSTEDTCTSCPAHASGDDCMCENGYFGTAGTCTACNPGCLECENIDTLSLILSSFLFFSLFFFSSFLFFFS